jgi:YD repeat-containing protein
MGLAVKESARPSLRQRLAHGLCVLLAFCGVFYCEPFFALARANASGRQVAVLESRTRPLGQAECNAYDPQGNLASRTSAAGETTEYEYNGLNLLTAKLAGGTAFQAFTYFKGGQRKSSTVVPPVGSPQETVYSLDSRNRPAGQLNPDGTLLEWSYDAAGNRTGVKVSRLGVTSQDIAYTWTARNELHEVRKEGVLWATYSYDEVGNRAGVLYANGTEQVLEYNSKNQLTRIENKAGGTVFSSYAYTLDSRGMRTSVTEQSGRKVEYSYDNLRRLTREKITEAGQVTTIGYALDLVGNRARKVVSRPGGAIETTDYTYNANDELLTEQGPEGFITYGYNANGETVSKSSAGLGSVTYEWDREGRLIRSVSSGQTLAFAYDVDGIRVGKSVNTAITRHVVDKNRDYAQVLEERDIAGNIQIAYVYGDDLISQERPGNQFGCAGPSSSGSVKTLENGAAMRSDPRKSQAEKARIDADEV